MGKKILILKASPREHGNSSTLADRAAVGARTAGAEVESVSLHRLDIRPCDGCDFCLETGVCVIKDDMQQLYPKLLSLDALILASPIYWFTYATQLKLCIDRWYAFAGSHSGFFKGKSVGIILVYGDKDVYLSGAINAIHTFETTFRYLKAPIAGMVYGSLSAVGDAEKNPALMQAAYDLGARLAE
jgi:multimeric flavodoxin WrbA